MYRHKVFTHVPKGHELYIILQYHDNPTQLVYQSIDYVTNSRVAGQCAHVICTSKHNKENRKRYP